MRVFSLIVRDPTHVIRRDDVVSFVGADASGSFGILAGHERFLTSLRFGLARFRIAGDDGINYLALASGLLSFRENTATICTQHFFLDRDRDRIAQALEGEIKREEADLREMHTIARNLEREMLRRLWELGRTAPRRVL
ncbi:F-type H+-transporting ATPase subunit epsilon [Methylacidimicrobium cyclopophantes]|uniref:ATP synthase epsilon chain n=1 Tax=Methylacidimicrobium cyclopophantes TaxID=1041766 RepID=A0A5E6M8P3_9BACT|nr:F0F1 ATP synthase subunit epsilon [Methylacidimicrobium cyclopophantes]VVM05931.1 F-type H+-transporting ATPase subunit epsilon [Methylacidimicrobium cyclopophantes]